MKSKLARIPDGKKFGFIKGVGKDEDYFFHQDDFQDNWDDMILDMRTMNVDLEFEVREGERGMRAYGVRRIK